MDDAESENTRLPVPPVRTKEALTLYTQGAAHYREGRFDPAIELFKKSIEADPNMFRAHVFLGMAFFEKGELDKSVEHYKTAIRIDGTYAKAHNNLGNALRRKGLLDEAFGSYKKAVRLDPERALYHYNLGVTCCDIGFYEAAVIELELAADLDPSFAEALYDLGNVYYLKDDLPKALIQFEKFLVKSPDNERVPEVMAKIRMLKRKVEEQKAKAQPKQPPAPQE